jgi:hypothetical protein
VQAVPTRSTFTHPRPCIAVDPQGNAVVVWQAARQDEVVIKSRSRRPTARRWSRVVTLSRGPGRLPEVGAGPHGHAVAVWVGPDAAREHAGIVAARRPRQDASWKPPVLISSAGVDNLEPQVAVDGTGNAMAVWVRAAFQQDTLLTGPSSGYVIQASALPSASSAWEAPVDLSARGANSGGAHVALEPGGTGLAVWQRPLGEEGGTIVQASDYE